MSHNKMYREIKGYEEGICKTSDIIDLCDDLKELFRYGKTKEEILNNINSIKVLLSEIESEI